MAVYDTALDAMLGVQDQVLGDKVQYRDTDTGAFNIPGRGIFHVQTELIDGVTQQAYISNTPSLWIRTPAPVEPDQNTQFQMGSKFFRVTEVRSDADGAGALLLLNEISNPHE